MIVTLSMWEQMKIEYLFEYDHVTFFRCRMIVDIFFSSSMTMDFYSLKTCCRSLLVSVNNVSDVCVRPSWYYETCVCINAVCATAELRTDSSSCNSHRTNRVKGCQNCTDWKARSEVTEAVTHPATQRMSLAVTSVPEKAECRQFGQR